MTSGVGWGGGGGGGGNNGMFTSVSGIYASMLIGALSQAFMLCASVPGPLVFTGFSHFMPHTAEGCLAFWHNAHCHKR